MAGGHIPGARNLPFGTLYDERGCFKQKDELRKLFAEAGVDPSQPFIASCGSGVTATSVIFAAHLLGSDTGALYDGSWSEWGADSSTPKATGPA
jgi:thiosulfate/3-mercaptopyruvate sulfurtransferase